jgi:hypothetical protein
MSARTSVDILCLGDDESRYSDCRSQRFCNVSGGPSIGLLYLNLNIPPRIRMSCTFNYYSDVLSIGPLQRLGNMFYTCGIDYIYRISSGRTSIFTGIHISSNTRTVREDWIA